MKHEPTDICGNCLKPYSEHCEFVPLNKPKGCKCKDVTDWFHPDNIPPVCTCYEEDSVGRCLRCEHDKECHE